MKVLCERWKRSAWRKRAADDPRLISAVAGLIAVWMRVVVRTSWIDSDGWAAVARAVEEHGAVIVVLWHQRLLMGPRGFDLAAGPFRTLTSDARAGRLAGIMMGKSGFDTTPMPRGSSGAAEMRVVLKSLRGGQSIGIAADGPRGPARVLKQVPIQWARATGKPVVGFAFSARRHVSLPLWDRTMLPLPFNRIALRWAIWERDVTARMPAEEVAAATDELQDFLNTLTDRCDIAAGHVRPRR